MFIMFTVAEIAV